MEISSNYHTNPWNEEEKLKESVYSFIENNLAYNKANVDKGKRYVDSGAFDDHDAFIAYNSLSKAETEEIKSKRLYLSIFPSPYFSHMVIKDEDGELIQIMLSDCADLDQTINVSSNSQIVPFKQSKDKPMLSMLFHQYQVCKAETFTVTVKDAKHERTYNTQYSVELIRNVEIRNRIINNIVQLVPELKEDDSLPAVDELLAQRLEENRSNVKLRNIIATLQKEQFDIIRTDIGTDFVVQGCAGSGKTQCLIHRLFFLRDLLGDVGWERVLLITPTQLFRNYSIELMRRYHLTNISNCSLANFYCTLLNAYDSRFKNRQYIFELTEEYLPDDYLKRVYDPEQISKIDSEIKRAISDHVHEGCRMLEIDFTDEQISAEFIAGIVQQLDERIVQFDERAQEFSKNTEYAEHLGELDKLDKQLKALRKKRESLESGRDDLDKQKAKFDDLKFEIEKAEDDLESWKEAVSKENDRRIRDYSECRKLYDAAKNTDSTMRTRYRRTLFAVLDATMPSGRKNQLDEENTSFLSEICGLARDDLAAFMEGQSEKTWLRRFTDKFKSNTDQIQTTQEDIEKVTEEIEAHSIWIQEFTLQSDSIENQRKTYRAGLEKTRYYLSRIESSVFEQEVWSALEPLKTECGIQTLHIERLEDGRQKQIRILYKSDLIFYIKIYILLHGKDDLPKYNLICIDEGQDLHSADYKVLKTLYPGASLNIFGDTAQALHESCGITDWMRDTGIDKTFEMNSNYRNVPAIVEFCNQEFGCKMISFGRVSKEQEPVILKDMKGLKAAIVSGENTVIVKNCEVFEAMCAETGLAKDDFDFLDMNADKESTGKIHCYSVFAAKGLEFSSVIVYAKAMNRNQKTVACTRAMEHLYYCE